MKKNILSVLTFIFVSIMTLTGCGSSSNSGKAGLGTAVVEIQENQIVLHANGLDFTLPLPFTKNLDSSSLIELTDLSLSVDGCTISNITFDPTSLVFDGGSNTQETLLVNGSFAQNCTPTGYTFTAQQKVTVGGKVQNSTIAIKYDYSSEIPETGVGIMNATTPLQIGEESTAYPITLQVTKDGYVAPERTVKLKPFSSQFGTISTSSTYTVVTDVNGIAQFDYFSPSLLPADGTNASLEIVVVDENDTVVAGPQEIVLNFKANNDKIDTNTYQLIAAPDTINIANAGDNKNIDLYLNDTGTNQPVANQVVIAHAFNPNDGTLNTYSTTTDANGHAVFSYTAPQTLPNSALTITFEVDNGNPVLTEDVTVNFGGYSTPPVSTTALSLIAAPDTISIASAGESKNIDLYLNNTSTNQPVEGQDILARTFNPNDGTLNTYSATTDVNGHVVFSYTAPQTLPTSTLQITFEIANGTPVKTEVVSVTFGGTPPPLLDTTNYTLVAVPTDINVSTTDDTPRVLDIYLTNSITHAPIANQEIRGFMTNIGSDGTLDKYTAITDTNGHATFIYTKPNAMTVGYSFDISFEIVGGTDPKTQTVGVLFVDENTAPPVNTATMNLTAVPNSVNITEDGEIRALSLYLNDSSTSQPVEGQDIIAHFFDPAAGTLNAYNGTTNGNGQVVFQYTAPESISGATDFNITFSIPNATDSLDTNVSVDFGAAAAADYNLTADDTITVTGTSEAYLINVALSRQESGQPWEPAVGDSVIAEFVMPIHGTISQYEAVVAANGIATFEYISPDDISGLSDINITFYYKNDITVTDTTLVTYNAQTVEGVDAMYVVPESFTVTEPGETREITIVTVNSENVGISTTVQLEQPFFNNTDYGSFDATLVTTDASGKATVIYTTPDSLSGITERNITVTETSESLTKELNINFGTPATIGTNYEISVEVPQFITVDSIDQISVKIHELGNPNNVISDTDVNEVNLTSIFTNILTFSGGDENTTYSGLGTNAIEVESKTLSGVAVIEVTASVYNGDNNVTLTTTVPLTILSGDVTAMSIFYVGSSETGAGQFVNTYTVHAVDKYANPAREGVTIHPSLINGTKVDPLNSVYGEDGQILNLNPDQFHDTTEDFNTAGVTTSDRLIIVPNASKFDASYLGNWTIDDVLSPTELLLSEQYYAPDENNLSYVIGNENRVITDAANVTYGVATADIETKAGGYVTDENGNVQFDVKFDPILAGHTVTIAAHAYDGNRTGVSKIAGLRWGNYSSTTELIDNDGQDHVVSLSLGINNISGDPLESLVDVDIVPAGIISSSAQCDLNITATPALSPDLRTDINGAITVQISTAATDPGVKECEISWSESNAHIYREY